MITAVGVNGNMSVKNPRSRDSGTGGFEIYARSSVALTENLNTEQGRKAYGIDLGDNTRISVMNCRLREGDDASCLNLDKPQKPRIMAADHKKLAELGAFSFNEAEQTPIKDVNPWLLLEDDDPDDDIIPAIADYATVKWSLGKKLGSFVEFTNQNGTPIKLKIAATLKGSILQGGLIISNDSFVRNFPDNSAYRVFLIDVEPADEENIQRVSGILSRRLRDYGFETMSTSDRLAMFNRVQNTYISIFQMLGGLGIILGTGGLAFIVVRNILGRLGELAMIWAVGYTAGDIIKIIFYEHIMLLGYGTFTGVAAAFVATYPTVAAADSDVPYLSIALTVFAVIAAGAVWTLPASWFALKGNLLNALRDE